MAPCNFYVAVGSTVVYIFIIVGTVRICIESWFQFKTLVQIKLCYHVILLYVYWKEFRTLQLNIVIRFKMFHRLSGLLWTDVREDPPHSNDNENSVILCASCLEIDLKIKHGISWYDCMTSNETHTLLTVVNSLFDKLSLLFVFIKCGNRNKIKKTCVI